MIIIRFYSLFVKVTSYWCRLSHVYSNDSLTYLNAVCFFFNCKAAYLLMLVRVFVSSVEEEKAEVGIRLKGRNSTYLKKKKEEALGVFSPGEETMMTSRRVNYFGRF